MDIDAAHRIGSRHFLTVGAEFRNDFNQVLKNFDPEPFVLYSEVHESGTRWGMFAQDEIKLANPLVLYAGARLDRSEGTGFATSPRIALIYTPTPATTFKLLAGRAFRAPNKYELNVINFQYKGNSDLEPEHIETLELIAQRFIGGGVQVSAAAFRNVITDLLTQTLDPADSLFVFKNLGETRSKGLELGLQVNRGHGITGQLSYSIQRTLDHATDSTLTNSPRQIVQAQLRSPVPGMGVIVAVDAQYMSARHTLNGTVARSHALANVSLFAPQIFPRLDLSASIYNAFNAAYGDPVGTGFTQDLIRQDGRSFRVRAALHY